MYHETIYLNLEKFVDFSQEFIKSGKGEHEVITEAEMIFDKPSPGAPMHVHPFSDEHFTVSEGLFDLFYDNEWRQLKAGESHTIPSGKKHRFRTSTNEKTSVTFKLTPWKDYLKYSFTIYHLIKEGKVKAGKNIKFLMYNAMAMYKFNQSTLYTTIGMKLYIATLSYIGRIIGLRLPPPATTSVSLTDIKK